MKTAFAAAGLLLLLVLSHGFSPADSASSAGKNNTGTTRIRKRDVFWGWFRSAGVDGGSQETTVEAHSSSSLQPPSPGTAESSTSSTAVSTSSTSSTAVSTSSAAPPQQLGGLLEWLASADVVEEPTALEGTETTSPSSTSTPAEPVPPSSSPPKATPAPSRSSLRKSSPLLGSGEDFPPPYVVINLQGLYRRDNEEDAAEDLVTVNRPSRRGGRSVKFADLPPAPTHTAQEDLFEQLSSCEEEELVPGKFGLCRYSKATPLPSPKDFVDLAYAKIEKLLKQLPGTPPAPGTTTWEKGAGPTPRSSRQELKKSVRFRYTDPEPLVFPPERRPPSGCCDVG